MARKDPALLPPPKRTVERFTYTDPETKEEEVFTFRFSPSAAVDAQVLDLGETLYWEYGDPQNPKRKVINAPGDEPIVVSRGLCHRAAGFISSEVPVTDEGGSAAPVWTIREWAIYADRNPNGWQALGRWFNERLFVAKGLDPKTGLPNSPASTSEQAKND